MVCKMMKRGVMGAALGAGALALVFGTSAPSYVRTTVHHVRAAAKGKVPVPFEIDRARQELEALRPAIDQCREDVVRSQVRIEKFQEEVVAQRASVDGQLKQVVAMRQALEGGEVLTGGASYSVADLKRDLANRWDRYQLNKRALAEREETLKQRREAVKSAREKLDNMIAQQTVLQSKIEAIEAKYQRYEANQAASREVGIDDTALNRVKQTVAEVEERVEVLDRLADEQAKISTGVVATPFEPARDIAKEIDSELKAPKPAPGKDL